MFASSLKTPKSIAVGNLNIFQVLVTWRPGAEGPRITGHLCSARVKTKVSLTRRPADSMHWNLSEPSPVTLDSKALNSSTGIWSCSSKFLPQSTRYVFGILPGSWIVNTGLRTAATQLFPVLLSTAHSSLLCPLVRASLVTKHKIKFLRLIARKVSFPNSACRKNRHEADCADRHRQLMWLGLAEYDTMLKTKLANQEHINRLFHVKN